MDDFFNVFIVSSHGVLGVVVALVCVAFVALPCARYLVINHYPNGEHTRFVQNYKMFQRIPLLLGVAYSLLVYLSSLTNPAIV